MFALGERSLYLFTSINMFKLLLTEISFEVLVEISVLGSPELVFTYSPGEKTNHSSFTKFAKKHNYAIQYRSTPTPSAYNGQGGVLRSLAEHL